MRFTPTLLLLVGLMGCSNAASQDAAVAAIRKPGGRVTIDMKSPDRPVTAVHLGGTQVTDAGLVHLKGLTRPARRVSEGKQHRNAGKRSPLCVGLLCACDDGTFCSERAMRVRRTEGQFN